MPNELVNKSNTVLVNYTGPSLPVRTVALYDHVNVPVPAGTRADFNLAGLFSGTINRMVSATSIPNTSEGTVFSLTPESASGAFSPTVRAHNSGGQSTNGVVVYGTATAAATFAVTSTSWAQYLEVGLAMATVDARSYTTGGVWPITYEKVSGPAWVTVYSNGTCGGIPNAAHSAEALVVRATDRSGNTCEGTVVTITTVAEFDRTTNVTSVAAGSASVWQTVIDHYVARGGTFGSGDTVGTEVANNAKVISLGAGSHTWFWTDAPSTNYGRFSPGSQPLIVRGVGPDTVINGWVYPKGASCIIFENLKINSNVTQGKGFQTQTSERMIWLKDVLIEGASFVVDPADPNGGDPWMTNDTYAWTAVGISALALTARQITFQNVHINKCSWAVQARGIEFGYYHLTTENVRVDCLQVGHRGAIIYGCVLDRHDGNFTNSQHRDGLQFQHSGSDERPRRMTVDRCLISSNGPTGVGGNAGIQGIFRDGGAGNGIGLPNDLHPDFVIRDTVSMNGTPVHGITMDRFANAVIERCLVRMHPNFDGAGTIYVQDASSAIIKDTIFDTLLFNGGAGLPGYNHRVVQSGNVVGTTITDIFPNWFTASTDLERLVMSPTWKAANPGKGPQWVRDLT